MTRMVSRAPAARRPRLTGIVITVSLALASGCTDGLAGILGSGNEDNGEGDPGGGSGSGNGNMGIHGEDGGSFAPPLPDGSLVTMLETELSASTEFVLRGTIPVPPDTFPRSDGKNVFAIEDFNGTLLDTQNEVVTKYAREADGAEVVEVIARVRRDPGLGVGDRAQYAVRVDPHGTVASPGSAGIEDLTGPTQELPESVLGLLENPTAIRISTRDVFGNEYACYPLDGTGHMQVERYGPSQSQLRIYQTMLPEPPVPGAFGTLPHFFGVHCYLSTLRGEDVVLFDVRFNNGSSGLDKDTDVDDPLDKVYFETIEIAVPTGWVLQQDFDDPFFGDSYLSGTKTVFPLVKPLQGGPMHVMRWQGQFLRRLALSTTAAVPNARRYLDGYGQGFCRRGSDSGHEFWSWWNTGTDRYFTQDHQLPSLEHVGLQSIRNTHGNTLGWMTNHLANGTGDGVYPIQTGALGWGHPYGVAYGGATSGAEIYMYEGVDVVEAASRAGLRVLQGTQRMHDDRQPNALYNQDGEPSSVEDWLIRLGGSGQNDYVPFEFYGRPILRGNDPFGFDQAPQFQIEQVTGSGRAPLYEPIHLSYDPTDIQHLIRNTRAPKALVWIANDSLAKDDLRMQAESGHLSYHQYNNTSTGGTQGSGLRSNMKAVAAAPGIGMGFGRGESWILDTMTAVYAFADTDWRETKRPWFDAVTRMLNDGQASCSGFVQSVVITKFLNAQFRARQMIEQSIMENAFRGVRETVYRDADSAMFAMMGEVLLDSLYAFVSDMAWFPGETAPWTHTAVGPLNYSKPVWCSRSQIPGNGYNPVYEGYQVWASFAFGYDMSGDQKFLDKALVLCGGAQVLLNGMQSFGLSNINNQAPTLALVQRLNGTL